MPHCSIQGWFETNWKPPSTVVGVELKSSSQMLIAAVATDVEGGDELHVLGPTLGEERDDERAGGRHEDQHRQDRERERAVHHSTPRPMTNHASSSTTPTPTMPA